MKYLVYLVVFLNFELLALEFDSNFLKMTKLCRFIVSIIHYGLYLVDSDTGDPLDNKIK